MPPRVNYKKLRQSQAYRLAKKNLIDEKSYEDEKENDIKRISDVDSDIRDLNKNGEAMINRKAFTHGKYISG